MDFDNFKEGYINGTADFNWTCCLGGMDHPAENIPRILIASI